ncbi:MAG: hypothetical protein ED556_11215 [Winogradskyella sp.]|uniref:hypothetical protein n=1 Tax=Winogradskyella sp. TaxID=1883156 RepID=UPI000F3B80E9|nr:hypothetical protein [Winogradskyella sp.]RNC85128.1 MAG: hypothetical protein ED556_11215 [Winogradskyella sp.]
MKEVKFILAIVTLIIAFNIRPSSHEINTTPICSETYVENSETIDSVIIKECFYKNHLFKSVGIPDYKGRYSYEYQIFKIVGTDTTKTKNSNFFKDKTKLIEELLNKKLKEDYNTDLKYPDLKNCVKQINFRHFNLDEFGVTFMSKDIMAFHIDYKGVSGACFNVSGNSVLLHLNSLKVID